MITWGALSALTMFVTTPTQFYTMRFVLGVAEAGFFPGMILYLTFWFPAERRSRMTGLFMTAVPISGLLGGPVSGWIMQTFAGVNGWAGWQWLFLLEGLPAVCLGLMVWFYLDDGIASAKWLDDEEKRLLSSNIKRESPLKSSHSFKEALGDKKVWILSLVYFAVVMGLYGISFWLPTLIKSSGVTRPMDIGLLSAIPYAAAIAAMILVSRSADSRRERKWHFAIPALLGALGLILSVNFAQNTVLVIAALTLACCGIMATLPLFWSYAPAFLGGTAAAGGIALIGLIGNLAGFASPYMVGYIKDLTQSTDAGIYALAACVVVSAILVMVSLYAFRERHPCAGEDGVLRRLRDEGGRHGDGRHGGSAGRGACQLWDSKWARSRFFSVGRRSNASLR